MRRRLLALPLAAIVVVLAGCAPIVTLTPAADATSPACASVVVRLPDAIDGLAKRDTDAQGTAAWGTPATVTLRCGVTTPGVSSSSCFTVGVVDWLVEDEEVSGSRAAVFTTYNRAPGVQVVVAAGSSREDVSHNDVLPTVSDAVAAGTRSNSRTCVAAPSSSAGPSAATSGRATPGSGPPR